jgi:SPP1 family predicted phage head-tail adaptor
MDAGRLDRRVTLKRRKSGVNDFGEPVDEWTTLVTVWANVAPVSDGERWRAGEVQAHITTRFQVRSSAFTRGITPKDRLICGGLTYDISGIKEVGRLDLLEITADILLAKEGKNFLLDQVLDKA